MNAIRLKFDSPEWNMSQLFVWAAQRDPELVDLLGVNPGSYVVPLICSAGEHSGLVDSRVFPFEHVDLQVRIALTAGYMDCSAVRHDCRGVLPKEGWMAHAFLFGSNRIKDMESGEAWSGALFPRRQAIAIWPARLADFSVIASTLPGMTVAVPIKPGPKNGAGCAKGEIIGACMRLLACLADGTVKLTEKKITAAGIARQLLDGSRFGGVYNDTVEKYIRQLVREFRDSGRYNP
jgi:hypothetical protein